MYISFPVNTSPHLYGARQTETDLLFVNSHLGAGVRQPAIQRGLWKGQKNVYNTWFIGKKKVGTIFPGNKQQQRSRAM